MSARPALGMRPACSPLREGPLLARRWLPGRPRAPVRRDRFNRPRTTEMDDKQQPEGAARDGNDPRRACCRLAWTATARPRRRPKRKGLPLSGDCESGGHERESRHGRSVCPRSAYARAGAGEASPARMAARPERARRGGRGPTGGRRATRLGTLPPWHRFPASPRATPAQAHAPQDRLTRVRCGTQGRFAPGPGLGAGHAFEGSSSDRTVPMGDRKDT